MTGLQELLSIGIPSLLIALAWLSETVQLRRIEAELIGFRKDRSSMREEHRRDRLKLLGSR